ncbi:hypothetical protein LP420_03695 [Massilia sp. B-10]|nr:hypothetical protein LP420_03695 [Massilia sp. B-10]
MAALYPDAPRERQVRFMAALQDKQDRLRAWAAHCPGNFDNRYLLVAAEMARVGGRDMEAMRAYDAALASARGRLRAPRGAGGRTGGGLLPPARLRQDRARVCAMRWPPARAGAPTARCANSNASIRAWCGCRRRHPGAIAAESAGAGPDGGAARLAVPVGRTRWRGAGRAAAAHRARAGRGGARS